MLGSACSSSAVTETATIAAKFVVEDGPRDVIIKDKIEPDARYTIEDAKFGDLRTKILKNTETGEYVQIVTDLAAWTNRRFSATRFRQKAS